jgi:hypothetical protein
MATSVILLGCLITLSTLALGELDLQELPYQIDGYLESKLITPEFSETIELLKQRKKLKPTSKGLDMKFLDGKTEEQVKEVINFLVKSHFFKLAVIALFRSIAVYVKPWSAQCFHGLILETLAKKLLTST